MIPLLYVILLDPDPEVLRPPYPDNFETILGILQGSIYKWSYHGNDGMVINAYRWSMYASVNWVIIGSSNGLSPVAVKLQNLSWYKTGFVSRQVL